jgi:hypothetical protein
MIGMNVEQSVKCELVGETEVLGENLSQPNATLSTTNPAWPDLGSNPDRRGGKPVNNRLSYGMAIRSKLQISNIDPFKFVYFAYL